MKKMLVMLIVFSIMCTGICIPGVSAAASITTDCLEIYTCENSKGTVWNDEKSPVLYVAVNNPNRAAISGNLSLKLCDKDANIVYSFDKTVAAGARETITEIVDPTLPYGTYTAEAVFSGDFGEITKTMAFSYAKYNGEQNDGLGISCHMLTLLEKAQIGADIVHGGGFGWVRDEIPWKFVETTKGVLKVPSDRERYLNTIYESGNKILLILNYGNQFYEDGNFPITDEGIAAYVKYCTYMVNRFKGKLSAVEIWNEPNIISFTGIDINGAQYTKLLKAAYTAIKEVDPELTVVGGVLTSLRDLDPRVFFEEMIEAGALNYMDAFSYHPYIGTGTYCDESSRINGSGVAEYDFAEQIAYVSQKITTAGKPDMPVWLTEFGTTSFVGSTGYTHEEQAINLVRAAAISEASGDIDRMFVYNLKQKGTDVADYESNFGLLDYNYNAKPAYVALSAFNNLVYNTKDNRVIRFSRPDGKVDSIQYNITSNPPESGKMEISFSARYDKGANVIGPEISDDLIGDGVLGVQAHSGKIVTSGLGTGEDRYVLISSYVPDQWYDFKITLDFDSKTYDVEASSRGEVLNTLTELDMIGCSSSSRNNFLTSAKYIGWRNWSSSGVGGAIDNLKIKALNDNGEEIILFDGFEAYDTVSGGSGKSDMSSCGYSKHKFGDLYAQLDKDEASGAKVGFTAHRYSDAVNGRTAFAIWTPEGEQTALAIKRDMTNTGDSHIMSASTSNAPILHTSENTVVRYYDIYGNEIVPQDEENQIITDEPIYVVCVPRLSVEVNEGKIIASGCDAMPGDMVSILAVNETRPKMAIDYIRQTVADKNGAYEFEFDVKKNENYSVYVCVGETTDILQKSYGDYGVSIDYFVNNEPYTGIEQFKSGDKLRAVVSAEKKIETNDNPVLYSCIYGSDKLLLMADSEKLQSGSGNTATAETEITIGNEKEISSIKFYLWNENFEPVISGVKENRDEK